MPSKPLTLEAEKEHEPHPVYSDYSHMPMSTMSFAVNLREEAGTDILSKILPMTKIIPKDMSPKRSPKQKKSPPKKKIISATCEREDCANRKDLLADLRAENDAFKLQQNAVTLHLTSAKNKKSLIEKSIQISQEKNEATKVDLESVQARIESIEVELDKGGDGADMIKGKMELVQKDIEMLKGKIDKDTTDIERLNESKTAGAMKFASTRANKQSLVFAEETRRLDANKGSNGYDDDSEED
jgi:chromosome segregation ATPase